MAFLKSQRKNVLLLLAEEFGVQVSESDLVKTIIRDIMAAPDFEEEMAQAFIERIKDELREQKESAERERERVSEQQERERVLEQQERENLRRFELEKLEKDREFELQKLKLANVENASVSSDSTIIAETKKRISLRDLVPRFDLKALDITLFLAIFERQAKKNEIDENEWVSQLIPILPAEISELIMRMPVEQGDSYGHVKEMLLKRYRISSFELRNKFEEHTRKHGSLWSDLAYDLNSYLENWLDSLQICDLQGLKNLMVTEQIKKRVDWDTKEHLIEKWETYTDPIELAEKLDSFENARKAFEKFETKSAENRTGRGGRSSGARGNTKRDGIPEERNGETDSESPGNPKRELDKKFEKRKPPLCFHCSSPTHLRNKCPEWIKSNSERVNHLVVESTLYEGFDPHLSKIAVNGVERICLKDSGSGIDVCSRNWVSKTDLTGESVLIRQPFDKKSKRYALARIILEGDFGTVITKAALKPSDIEDGPYLMGNQTAKLIDQAKRSLASTRSRLQGKKRRRNNANAAGSRRAEKTGSRPNEVVGQNIDDPLSPPVRKKEPQWEQNPRDNSGKTKHRNAWKGILDLSPKNRDEKGFAGKDLAEVLNTKGKRGVSETKGVQSNNDKFRTFEEWRKSRFRLFSSRRTEARG